MKKLLLALAVAIALMPANALAMFDTTYKNGDSGGDIAQIQNRLRDLGYFNYRTTNRLSDFTEEAIRKFQSSNGLDATGKADVETQTLLFSNNAKSASRNKAFVSVWGKREYYPKEYGAIKKWEEMDKLFKVGDRALIKDLYSDATFTMTRTGGVNNAEVTPVSQTDADSFVRMCGGAPTWEKRPVLVKLNGETYAGAIFCTLGHAGTSELGTTQVYFSGSTSDLFGIPDIEMDTAVLKAAGEIKQ